MDPDAGVAPDAVPTVAPDAVPDAVPGPVLTPDLAVEPASQPGRAAAADADVAPRVVPFRLGHRPALDGLRGIAVAMVFVYHVASTVWRASPAWMLHGGALGVDLFFVLSGFLITVLLLGEAGRTGRVSLRGFAARRARRLVPVLVAFVAVVMALALAGVRYTPGRTLTTAVTTLSFTHNWAVLHRTGVYGGHLWSVAVEAQFYLVWAVAVVVALRARRPHAVLAVTAVAGIAAVVVWRAHLVAVGDLWFDVYIRTSARFDAPLVGALAGVVASAGWLPWFRGRVAAVAGAVGVALVVMSALLLRVDDPVLYRGLYTFVAVCAAVAVLAVVRAAPGRFLRSLSVRPLIVAGLLSYSVYVWHLPVFQIVDRNGQNWALVPRVAVAVGVSLVLAVLSYRFVERPFVRRRRLDGQPVTPNGKQRSSRAPKA